MAKRVGRLFGYSSFAPSEEDPLLLNSNKYVGVELEYNRARRIELEPGWQNFWEMGKDGSLHDQGIEAKFNEPLSGADITKALRLAEPLFSAKRIDIETSMHVHINALDSSTQDLGIFIQVLMAFDDRDWETVAQQVLEPW